MFTGTADGRVVKLENGEVETIARFGSGPCSKSVTPDVCLFQAPRRVPGGAEFPRSRVLRGGEPDGPARGCLGSSFATCACSFPSSCGRGPAGPPHPRAAARGVGFVPHVLEHIPALAPQEPQPCIQSEIPLGHSAFRNSLFKNW